MSYSIDANLLLYASDRSSPFHEKAVELLESAAAKREILGITWSTVMAYLRVATHSAIFSQPLTPREAMENIESLMALPHVKMIREEKDFWSLYQSVADRIVPRGNLVPDTHLATVLLQNGIKTLFTNDVDFRRFEFLDVVNPLA